MTGWTPHGSQSPNSRMPSQQRPCPPQTESERGNVTSVCRHLALVAVDGATDEVAATLTPDFRLHLDGIDTGTGGYLGLIEANHAAHSTRPPLDVLSAEGVKEFVTARLEPRCLAHFRMRDGLIAELWMTVDWNVWRDWLAIHTMT